MHKIVLKIFIMVAGYTITPESITDGLSRLNMPIQTKIELYDATKLTSQNYTAFYYEQLKCNWEGISCVYILPPVDGYKFGGHSLVGKRFSNVFYAGSAYDRVQLMIIISEYLKGLGCRGTGDKPSIVADNAYSLEYSLSDQCYKKLKKL